jgi:hypothetical protein
MENLERFQRRQLVLSVHRNKPMLLEPNCSQMDSFYHLISFITRQPTMFKSPVSSIPLLTTCPFKIKVDSLMSRVLMELSVPDMLHSWPLWNPPRVTTVYDAVIPTPRSYAPLEDLKMAAGTLLRVTTAVLKLTTDSIQPRLLIKPLLRPPPKRPLMLL